MTSDKFKQGIHNAVRVCMNTQQDDRVFIYCDQETSPIGNALVEESKQIGAEVRMIVLESYGPRPLSDFPKELIKELVDFKPTLTYFAAESKPGEI